MRQPAIEAKSLSRSFGGLKAVDHLDLEVVAGEIFGLVGPDGAGKTTTMRLLTAIMDPSEGEAYILGRNTVREAEAIKEHIGYMSQRFGLYPDLSVLENIHFYADIYGVPRLGREEKIEELLAFSNLTPYKKRKAGNLSGGMKQKLGLACALVHTPQVLFLDEPTNGVDPVSRRDFWRILYDLVREGLTIFVSTAYLDEAERCTRVGLIHHGRLLAADTPEQVKKLMHGTLLEVVSSGAREAIPLLRKRLPLASVSLFGDRLHVASEEPEQAREVIEAVFREKGFAVETMDEISPSLEDVFVSVLTRKE
jgi:ABC-2 type transport system ATP-binding protein